MVELTDILLRKEERTEQWVVYLRKTGRQLSLYRSPPGQRDRAANFAVELATFLDLKITCEDT